MMLSDERIEQIKKTAQVFSPMNLLVGELLEERKQFLLQIKRLEVVRDAALRCVGQDWHPRAVSHLRRALAACEPQDDCEAGERQHTTFEECPEERIHERRRATEGSE